MESVPCSLIMFFHLREESTYCPFFYVLSDCIKRIFHGRAEIQNFSLSVEKFLSSECSKRVKHFSSREEKFCVSKWPCDVLFIIKTPMKYQPFHFKIFCCKGADLLYGHSNGDLFVCENDMLFSHVRPSCFYMKTHLVFHQSLHNKIIILSYPGGRLKILIHKQYSIYRSVRRGGVPR